MKISHTIHHSPGRHNNLSILLASSADRQSFSSAVINPYHCDIENIDSFVYSLLLRCSTNSQEQQHSDPFRLFLLRCGNRHLYVCLLIQLTSSTLARVKYPIGDGLFCALVSILEGLPGTVSQAPPTSRHRKDFCRRGNRISRESTNKSSGFRLLEGNRFWAGPRKTEEQRSRTGRAINIKIIGCMIIIMMIVCRIRIGFKCALLN